MTRKVEGCIVYYRLEFDKKTNFPQLFESIRIDEDLHVQLQHNGLRVLLPDWFVVGNNAKLNRISNDRRYSTVSKKSSRGKKSNEDAGLR